MGAGKVCAHAHVRMCAWALKTVARRARPGYRLPLLVECAPSPAHLHCQLREVWLQRLQELFGARCMQAALRRHRRLIRLI